jgi:hypothetical protein
MTARAKLKEATARLNARTDELERMADWHGDLLSRIARRQLVFELVDYEVDFDDLIDEVAAFRAVCLALAASSSQRAAA